MTVIAAESGAGRQRVVVVGVDGSVNSAVALQWAAGDVAGVGGRLCIVCAWHSGREAVANGRRALAARSKAERVATATVSAAIAAVASRALEVTGEVGQGPASEVLVAAAAATGADLLVVGARGLEGARRVSLGSVSSRCAVRAPCPVVVVPAQWVTPGVTAPELVSTA